MRQRDIPTPPAVAAFNPYTGGKLNGFTLTEEAVTGGIGSVIGGGSFENGAITGAFRYLFSGVVEGGVSPAAVAGDIWNLPNTAIGLTVGGLDILAGVAEGQLPSFSFSPQGALQISNLPNILGKGAITFGDVQLYTGYTPKDCYCKQSVYTKLSGFEWQSHEDGHTIQGSVYGPLWLPAYGAGALIYGWDSNPFETHADYHAVYGTSALP